MKKSLLFALTMAFACYGVANAELTISVNNVNQPANDTALFALPVNPDLSQEIWTAYSLTNPMTGVTEDYICGKFQAEYLVTALDFTMGDTNKGTATLPANAKVIGLGLDGYDIGSDLSPQHDVRHYVTAWCRNIARSKMELDALDLFDGYNVHPPVGDLFTDTDANPNGILNVLDQNANDQNPAPVVNIDFGTPTDPDMPFWYKGENIYLTLWLINPGTPMKYKYMSYDNAEAKYASLMRSGNLCFNNESQYDLYDVFNTNLMYELPQYRLPAFYTPYFTNDIRVTVSGYETEYQLRDAEGNIYYPEADGNFYCMDHTKQYTVYSNGKPRGTFTFENIYKDIDLEITNTTAVEELDATKAVAGVAYYNMAGQQMQEANGVTIVVTTYTDGSTTTAKVIK